MNILLSDNINSLGVLFGQLYVNLYSLDNEVNISEDIYNEDFSKVNVAIVHPEYDNKNQGWSKLDKIMDEHKNIQFHLMINNASERKDFFGIKENLIYIDNNNTNEMYSDPVKFITNQYTLFLQKQKS
jgi:hypothetical protein